MLVVAPNLNIYLQWFGTTMHGKVMIISKACQHAPDVNGVNCFPKSVVQY